jgi:hypothetical protein
MSELDPVSAPNDIYHDLENIPSLLEAVARQNETPLENIGLPLKGGGRTERVGRVLLAVPGFPCDAATIVTNVYPSQLRHLAAVNTPEDEIQKRRVAFQSGVQASLGGVLVAEFLHTYGYRQQKGTAWTKLGKRVFYRAIPLTEPAQVGYRKIGGRVIDWQEPVWLYGKTE